MSTTIMPKSTGAPLLQSPLFRRFGLGSIPKAAPLAYLTVRVRVVLAVTWLGAPVAVSSGVLM